MPSFTRLGRYFLQRELGRGAMGVVYEAFDPVIERTVAIKTILPRELPKAEATNVLERFKREAQSAGRLSHPGIVSVYDFGELIVEDEGTRMVDSGVQRDGDRVVFIAMEFVKGRELREYFETNERFSLIEVERLMGEILDALAYAHNQGVIHRDMKPSNLMILENRRVKITDFGIARIEGSDFTKIGTVMGTPSYMSPEQFNGQIVDSRSDLFSCGVILYQFLTGEKPFTGDSTTSIMYKVLLEEPMAPSKLNVALPTAWDTLVQKALAKRPNDRFQSAAEFAEAIKSAVAGFDRLNPVLVSNGDDIPAHEKTLDVAATPIRPKASKVSVAAKSVRRDIYDRIAAITRDPGSVPLLEAFTRIESCLEAGECLLALNACESLAKLEPSHLRVIQLWALALARSGASSKANLMMENLAGHGTDEETLGILARTYKDLWLQTGDRTRLAQARDTYLTAHEVSNGTWSGINAATLALVSGDARHSKQLALDVLALLDPVVQELDAHARAVETHQASANTDDPAPSEGLDSSKTYWNYATIGEAALILDRIDLASLAYGKAISLSQGQLGNRASTKRNAELVLSVNGAAREMILERFSAPRVVAFSGHMPDAPNRPQMRFHSMAEGAVYKRILAALTGWEAQIGFSGAAAGADILFLEAMSEMGGETNIVLPYPAELFIKTSVAPFGNGWEKRLERVLRDARQVTVLSDFVGDELAFRFSAVVLAGLAKLRAAQVCGELCGLTVWDLNPGSIGGTSDAASDLLRRGVPMYRLSPSAQDEQFQELNASQALAIAKLRTGSTSQKMISMLFADAVGFSKLSEAQIPAFLDRFLGGVRRVMDRQKQAPITVNTWGDGLYFTFESVIHANEFALDLSELVDRTVWRAFGLPNELNLRIALHTAPAFEILDPVTRQKSFTGTHVSRAARIEPVTPPGFVYCSEAHAALVALENVDSYHCEYVGNMPYAKGYGVFPTYSLTRRGAAIS